MNEETVQVLIWGKTYPELSTRYTETVCTAGVRVDGRPIRLYPVPLRYLNSDQQYRLYDLIDVAVMKNKSDPRPESFKIRAESIVRLKNVKPDDRGWAARRAWIFKDLSWQFGTVAELKHAESSNGRSLGIITPGVIEEVRLEAKPRVEEEEYRNKIESMRSQRDLFLPEYKELAYRSYDVKLRWRGCPGHDPSR